MSHHRAPTVAGSASGSKQALLSQQHLSQEGGVWSLLSKTYGSQMLSYMVAVDDAKAILDRMRHMRPGPSLYLPSEVQCMNIWQVLQGTVQQQRVWTFGKQQPPADAPTSAMLCSNGTPGNVVQHKVEHHCISSSEPLSIRDGVKFSCCSAGLYHSAAAAEGGYIFTWGCNDKGQLGCDTSTQEPVAVHVLPPAQGDREAAATTTASAGSVDTVVGCSGGSAIRGCHRSEASSPCTLDTLLTVPEIPAMDLTPQQEKRVCQRSESLITLATTMKLPHSLVNGLAQQQCEQRQQVADDAQLQSLLELEAPSKQQTTAGQGAVDNHGVVQHVTPAVAAPVHRSANDGLLQQQRHTLQQQGEAHDKHTLAVYRIHVGQAVRMVACGERHTLAALSSSGLMAWGLNDKGQLGVPPVMCKQVQQPLRVHGFNGQRLMCISAGNKHSAAVYEGGILCTWGHGRYGRLGLGGCPDILPPSIVGGLRGCIATQVACGTAHTLVLTADGKVYAWGYNGQGALGTGDEEDRLVPTLVPGLPSCVQVAAAASSMALSCTGEVYQWGGAAQMPQARNRLGADSKAQNSQAGTGLGHTDASAAAIAPAASDACTTAAADKTNLAWLQGIHVGQMTCGIENAAAVSLDGKLVLWGCKQNMPQIMLQQAQALATDRGHAGLGSAASAEGVLYDSHGKEQASTAVHSNSSRHSACIEVADNAQLLDVMITVNQDGCVRVLLSVVTAVHTSTVSAGIADVFTCPQKGLPQLPGCTKVQSAAAAIPEGSMSDHTPKSELNPESAEIDSGLLPEDHSRLDVIREPVKELSCGAAHHIMLCQPSVHTPTIDELWAAVLALVQAYIRSYLSRSTSSLNALMQQEAIAKQEAEANDAGEEGSIAHSALSRKSRLRKPAGSMVGGYAASSGSCVASLPARTATLDPGAYVQQDQQNAATGGGTAALPPLYERKASSLRHSAVAFATDTQQQCPVSVSGSTVAGDDNNSRARSPAQSSRIRAAGQAADTTLHPPDNQCAASIVRGAGGSVHARSLDKTGGAASASGAYASGPESCASAADGPEELNLHGIMLLCREVCLVDNITEHLDIMRCFELVLHRKRGRLGPSYSRPGSPGPAVPRVANTVAAALSSPITQQQQGQQTEQHESSGLCNSVGSENAGSDVIRVVHVVRPGEAVRGVTADETEAAAISSLLCATSPQAVMSSRPSTAAAGVLDYETLDANEVLELLLLVMKERHPRYRRQPDVLLQLLAGWHMARLQGRKPDKGPPWLLRQMLQPQLLRLLESSATSEMLHGIYIHLTGSSSNPHDLSMSLTDIRRGLKQAAGYRTLQESNSSSPLKHSGCMFAQGTNRLNGKPGFQASTESSRGKSCASCSPMTQHSFRRNVELNTCSGSDDSAVKTFHLPLYKVAAFLRSAKLLPRLLDKYISQLQRIGEERKERSALMSLPVMPVLKASVRLEHAGNVKVARQASHKCRVVSKADLVGVATPQGRSSQQQDRLAQLPEASSVLTSTSGLNQLQQHEEPQQDEGCAQVAAAERALCTNRSMSVCKRTSGAGGSQGMDTSRSLAPTTRSQLEETSRRSAVMDVVMAQGGVIDAAVLDSVELAPMRARAASIIVQGPRSNTGTRAGHAGGQRLAKGAMQLVLQLPSPRSHALSTGSGNIVLQQQQHGDAVWEQLVKTHLNQQQQQPQQQSATAATHLPRKLQGKGTYQQQQAVLKRKRLTAEAEAKIADELEQIRRDTWIVFMLVELLGSYLVTPPWEAKVKLPRTVDLAAECETLHTGACKGSDSSIYCNWKHGYVYSGEDAAASTDSQAGNKWQATYGSSSGGGLSRYLGRASVDIMHHCISYPQFVEVLLCLLGARATVLLQPEVKQLRSISADEEMKEHAKVMLDCISSWRSGQLSPCAEDKSPLVPAAGGVATDDQNDGGASETGGPIAHLYCMYSSMEIGTNCLALRKGGFLKLLADARITGRNDSVVTATEAAAMFDELVTCSSPSGPTANKAPYQQTQSQTTSASDMQTATDPADLASRPVFSPTQRQSTFMRCVTSQLLLRLEMQTDTGDVNAALQQPEQRHSDWFQTTAARQLQKQAAGPSRDTATGRGSDKPGSSGSCYSEMSIYTDDHEHQQQKWASEGNYSPEAGNMTVDAKIEEALKWQAQGQGSSAQTDNVAIGLPDQAGQQQLTSSMVQRQTCKDKQQSHSKQLIQTTAAVRCGMISADATSIGQSSGVRSVQPKEGDDACVFTLSQFQQALTLLSRKCFPRIANKTRAWRLLIHKHIQPLADQGHSRFDVYYSSLATPGVMALLTAWQGDLQQLYQAAVTRHGMQQIHSTPASLKETPEQIQPLAQHNELPLFGFLELLQDSGAIPELLEPADVQQVLRRVMLQRLGHLNTVFTSLDCKGFGHALAMCGLAAFGGRKLQTSPLRQYEVQMAAFLTYIGLPPLPGHLEMLSSTAQQPQTVSKPSGNQTVSLDPYMEWWSLEFDPTTENRKHDHLSTLSYMPVMVQEHVSPPLCCPAVLLPILSAAQVHHQHRQVDDALRLYAEAEVAWRQHLPVQDGELGALPPSAILYLSAAASGCLVTGGRDEEGWEVLESCESVLRDLHEAGADAAVWHAAAGVALYHCGNLQAAFDHCVRAYVIRSECAPLGPTHPDTAAAAHNLGVVLDCLGKSSRGLQLVEQARSVFNSCLGLNHPRTLTAARNVQHIKHKIIKLSAEPLELLTSAAEALAAQPAISGGRYGKMARPGAVAADNEQQVGSDVNGMLLQSSSSDRGYQSSEASDLDDGPDAGHGHGQSPGTHAGRSSRNSMQERLQAVSKQRRGRESSNMSSKSSKHMLADTREYTDPNHLGAGVFKASGEQKQLYDAMKLDIAAHAQAGDKSSQQTTTVEMQVVQSVELPRQAAVAISAPDKTAVVVLKHEQAGAGGVGSSGSLSTDSNKFVEQLARKGPLLDATVTAVKKPLSVEEARRLRRQQQQANVQSSNLRNAAQQRMGLGGNLLDKLY